jgi:Protein-L-isoaspartate(D-aspartate) O-methyltransferase (PCMT)
MSAQTTNTSDARREMIDVQIAGRGIRDKRVLEALRVVPREAFVEEGFEEFAYEDGPLPIGAGQTISQPYIVALDRVLEVGAGSGYAAERASTVLIFTTWAARSPLFCSIWTASIRMRQLSRVSGMDASPPGKGSRRPTAARC